jgi:hypothetical protein
MVPSPGLESLTQPRGVFCDNIIVDHAMKTD